MTEPLPTLSIDKARLKKDIALMEEKAPEAQLTEFESDEYPLGWSLIISTDTAEYHIKICYHTGYPTNPPHVFETSGTIDTVTTPHINQTGRLSLSSPQQDPWEKKSSIASFINTIVAWIYSYEFYLANSHWPGIESTSYDQTGTIEFHSPDI